jgi:hypothetical protein
MTFDDTTRADGAPAEVSGDVAGPQPVQGGDAEGEGSERDRRLAAVGEAIEDARQAADQVADQQGLSDDERRTAVERVAGGPGEGGRVTP